jgi:hypothetical protein
MAVHLPLGGRHVAGLCNPEAQVADLGPRMSRGHDVLAGLRLSAFVAATGGARPNTAGRGDATSRHR